MSSLVNIGAADWKEYHGGPVPVKGRLYANKSFRASDGTFIQAGRNGKPDFYQEFDLTLTGTTIRIEDGDAYATTDSDQPDVTYTFIAYDANSRVIDTIFTLIKIYPEPNPATWEAITEYSKAVPQFSPSTYMTSEMFEARLATILDGTLKASQTQIGVAKLDVDPDDLTNPIAIGMNSPLVTALASPSAVGRVKLDVPAADPTNPIAVGINSPAVTTPASPAALGKIKLDVPAADPANPVAVGPNSALLLHADVSSPSVVGSNSPKVDDDLALDYSNSFATAISTIGSAKTILAVTAPVTVSSSVTLPDNIQLDVRAGGLITIASGTFTIGSLRDPGNRQIFAGPGNVRLGRGSNPHFNTAWFTGPTSGADITNAINQLFASCVANFGGRVRVPGGVWATSGAHVFPTGTILEGSAKTMQYDNFASEIRMTPPVIAINTTANSFFNLLHSVQFIVAAYQSIAGTGLQVGRIVAKLQAQGAPTGNVVVKIYAHSGTFGTSSIGTGAALATSDPVNVATVGAGAMGLYAFNFSGVNQIVLANGTNYVIAVEYVAPDGTNYLRVAANTVSVVPGNTGTRDNGGVWTADPYDLYFEVYGTLTGSMFKMNPGGRDIKFKDLMLSGNSLAGTQALAANGVGGVDDIVSGIAFEHCTVMLFEDAIWLHDDVNQSWQVRQVSIDNECVFDSNTHSALRINTVNCNIRCDADIFVPSNAVGIKIERCGMLTMDGTEFAGPPGNPYITPQVVKQTITGADVVTTAGLAHSIVTATGLPNSPVTVDVPLDPVYHTNAAAIATAFRQALAKDPSIASFLHVFANNTDDADIYLMPIDATAPDAAAFNFSIDTGTAVGVTNHTTSTIFQHASGSDTQAEAAIDITGPYVAINLSGTLNEALRYFIKHEWSNHSDGNISLKGCGVQGKLAMLATGRVHAVGCTFYPKTIRDHPTGSGSLIILDGCGTGQNVFINGAFRHFEQRAHNISDVHGPTSSIVYETGVLNHFAPYPHSVLQGPMRTWQSASSYLWPLNSPWFEIAGSPTRTNQILLRLGTADSPGSGFAQYYYDFYRDMSSAWAGWLRIEGNQAGATGIKTNGPIQPMTVMLAEQAPPGAPPANTVVIYAQDNGSGKTQLMALFPTGAAQQIAIQP